MGLLFSLQPDLRRSEKNTLILRSSPRRFSVGSGLVFGAALLATMYLAAAPLFSKLWNEGNFFDRLITGFIVGSIALYPLAALVCWFFEERVVLTKVQSGFHILSETKLFRVPLKKQMVELESLEQLVAQNIKGALNVAALESDTQPSRYATKGHWMLLAHGAVIEKRAKRDDIELLRQQILEFYKQPS
jgi:hypothetical protein